jgi:hypothetical protein
MFSSNAPLVGSGVSAAAYIEDVFSTYLYAGNGSTQTITNGINLSTNGGLVWMKGRSGATDHALYDTARGATFDLVSNTTAAQTTKSTGLTSFGATGFSIGALAKINTSAATYASWTFRKQPKFFDVVTYTGTGANRTIAHSLGSVPGSIIVKRTDTTADWQVYHRSLANTEYMVLNTTAAVATGATRWNSTTPTSTVFSVGTDASVNASGGTYVAYIYAHNAGGFGLTGTDNVISCGSYSGNSASPPTITLGWEPQFVMVKLASYAFGSGGWHIFDTMRGMSNTSPWANLNPNLSDAESNYGAGVIPTATGFKLYGNDFEVNTSDGGPATYIYIAIRRGPMKVPTSGTSVFAPVTANYAPTDLNITTGFPVDLSFGTQRSRAEQVATYEFDRLRGSGNALATNNTNAEATFGTLGMFASNTSFIDTFIQYSGVTSGSLIYWNFRRAPGFFDEVCYTGTGTNTTQAHNLGVVPELMIVKSRSGATAWQVYSSALANTEYLVLNTTAAKATGATRWNSTTPTSSVFSLGAATEVNNSGATYVAYLFATAAGVSKVGSYTGTGATQTISCGFTGGARFVLIKRTDSTGDWYVWDTARGMVSGTDPSLLLNSTAAEVNANSIYTTGVGFQIVSTAAGINASGGSYIFLAIA